MKVRRFFVSVLCFAVFFAGKAPDIPAAEALLLLSMLFFVPAALDLIQHENGMFRLISACFSLCGMCCFVIPVVPFPAFFIGLAVLYGDDRLLRRPSPLGKRRKGP